MKKTATLKQLIFSLFALFIALASYAQPPTGFSYQAVFRDGDGKVIPNQVIRLTVRLTASSGTPIYYTEIHQVTTNEFGLINLVVGQGGNSRDP